MAIQKEKPLVIHLRGSESLVFAHEIMTAVNLPKHWPIHMHCFTYSWDDCRKWAQEWPRMKFGFTSDSFYEDVVKNLPLSKILLETDGPYFLPKKV